jgi:formylglycine-generating enzyme required for sulfatase activity
MNLFTRRDWLTTSALAGAGLMALRLHAAETRDDGEMVLIPGGLFLMGTTRKQADELAKQFGHHPSWLDGEVPQRRVKLKSFRIDKYPVTNRRYFAFVKATGARAPFDWPNGEPNATQLDLPVRYVERKDARAFAKWAGKRLPTAAEWEKAARGTDGQLYPWGNTFDPEACQHDCGGVVPPTGPASVTAHPRGASPYGVMDLIGNLAEYCEDGPGPNSAYIKGGCWLTTLPLNLRCAAVGMSGAENNALDYLGFRCAKDA